MNRDEENIGNCYSYKLNYAIKYHYGIVNSHIILQFNDWNWQFGAKKCVMIVRIIYIYL